MLPRRRIIVAAVLSAVCGWTPDAARAEQPQIDNLHQLYAALSKCWRSPQLSPGDPGMQITVRVSFKRDGAILGKPRITFESSPRSDSLAYRIAVMDTLQRCTPLRFTDSMGNAVAGRPFTLRFDDRRISPDKPDEKRAWLTTTTS